jgi:hypothetical protein
MVASRAWNHLQTRGVFMSIRTIIAAMALCVIPLAAQTADNEEFNPYKSAKVGDFATYKLNVKLGQLNIAASTTQSITAKTDKEATVKVVSSLNGMDLPTQTQTIDLTKPYDPTKMGNLPQGVEGAVKKLKDGKEKVKVGAKEYDSTWTTYELEAKSGGMDIKGTIKMWMSKDVTLGVVKMEMTADVASQKIEMSMELTESGNKKP